MRDLRACIEAFKKSNQLVEIEELVDPTLELAEIHRRVAAADGPALLFRRVKGSNFPVVTNLFGSQKRVEMSFGPRPDEALGALVSFATQKSPFQFSSVWNNRSHLMRAARSRTRKRSFGPVLEAEVPSADLDALPFLKLWPEDGGNFLTLPLVYTEPVEGTTPPNLGIYRIQRYEKSQEGRSRAGLHWQITKGGGFHHYQAEALNQRLPVNIFLGGPPALLLSAIAPLPENVPELLFAAFLQNSPLDLCHPKNSGNHYPIVSSCEFALTGYAEPHERLPEGPFGDHYGYYSLQHPFPVFHCTNIYHRKDAIFPATVVGKPRQEDFYLGNYLQKFLSPLFPIVMPAVRSLWSYAETGFHSLSAAVVKERYARECMQSAFRILGEGQLSLTKFLLLTDQMVDLENFPLTLQTVLERFRPETDLFLFGHLSYDTLDYTGPSLNRGSRGVMVGVGEPVRTLPKEFTGRLPLPFKKARAFCPGCLVIEVEGQELPKWSDLLQHACFAPWPLVIAVDHLDKTLKHVASFLWTVFTRFEPAADVHSARYTVHRNHICHSGPILIDARMKPSYPKEVACDVATSRLVTSKWDKYFPQGMEMGDSEVAHL